MDKNITPTIQEPKPKGKTLPAVPMIILILILLLLIIGLLVWALLTQKKLESVSESVSSNPFCLRVVCQEGENNVPVEVPLKNDPQKKAYATLNYCTVNGPPEEFQYMVKQCEIEPAETGPDSDYALFGNFLNWYPEDYIPACGYVWKGTDVLVKETASPTSDSYPNGTGPNGLNSIHSDMVYYTLKCASQLGMNTNEEYRESYEKLYDYCGEACDTSDISKP